MQLSSVACVSKTTTPSLSSESNPRLTEWRQHVRVVSNTVGGIDRDQRITI